MMKSAFRSVPARGASGAFGLSARFCFRAGRAFLRQMVIQVVL